MRVFLVSALLTILLFSSTASAQPASPAGNWRSVVKSPVVSTDVVCQIKPDCSLVGQGTIVYVATSRIYQLQGHGSWSASPPEARAPQ